MRLLYSPGYLAILLNNMNFKLFWSNSSPLLTITIPLQFNDGSYFPASVHLDRRQ